jgi:hypothetical protein
MIMTSTLWRSALASLLLAATIAFPGPGSAATRHEYTGQNYASTNGTMSGATRATGQFTTAGPLAPNLVFANVLPQVQSFSFSDGVNTYASGDPDVRVYQFNVTTDANGTITGWNLSLQRWRSGSSPHAAGNLVSALGTASAADTVEDSATCSAVGASPFTGVSDVCLTIGLPRQGDAIASVSGGWTSAPIPATPVPVGGPLAWVAIAAAIASTALRSRRAARNHGKSSPSPQE